MQHSPYAIAAAPSLGDSFAWRFFICAALFFSCAAISRAQNTDAKPAPVIDVHVHAMDGNFPGA